MCFFSHINCGAIIKVSPVDLKMDERLGKAGYACFKELFEIGLSLKATGDCLIIAPPFICEKKHIDEIIEKLRTGITNYMKTR